MLNTADGRWVNGKRVWTQADTDIVEKARKSGISDITVEEMQALPRRADDHPDTHWNGVPIPKPTFVDGKRVWAQADTDFVQKTRSKKSDMTLEEVRALPLPEGKDPEDIPLR